MHLNSVRNTYFLEGLWNWQSCIFLFFFFVRVSLALPMGDSASCFFIAFWGLWYTWNELGLCPKIVSIFLQYFLVACHPTAGIMIGILSLIFRCSLVSTTRISVVTFFLWTTEPKWKQTSLNPNWTDIFFFYSTPSEKCFTCGYLKKWQQFVKMLNGLLVFFEQLVLHLWSHYVCCLVRTYGK